jgi:hypothetical protein
VEGTPLDLPLRDIHLPAAINWWPPAYGWWILLGTALLILAAYFWWAHLVKPTLKKEAAKELKAIEQLFSVNRDAVAAAIELSTFLRRIAISQNHATPVAGLTGHSWLQFLDRPLEAPEFSTGVGKLLLTAPYQPAVDSEAIAQLFQLCHKWVDRL